MKSASTFQKNKSNGQCQQSNHFEDAKHGWESTPQAQCQRLRQLGYCSMGCPVNAKQGMLVTTTRLLTPECASTPIRAQMSSSKGTIASTALRKRLGSQTAASGTTLTICPAHRLRPGCNQCPAFALRINDNNRVGLRTYSSSGCNGAVFDEPIQEMGHHNPLQRIILIEGQQKRIYWRPQLTPCWRHSRILSASVHRIPPLGILIAIHDDGIIDETKCRSKA